MIRVENIEVFGWEAAIRGMRNPLNSWDKSDSTNNIITLCGSSKFKNEFLKIQKELTLKGYLVLSLGLFGHSGDEEAWEKKELLDKTHLQKIDISSSIFVIDVKGYIGQSTANEISYAQNHNKKIYYYSHNDLESIPTINNSFIGPNDLKLMQSLVKAGTDHSKFMRMINVTMDITAPMYWAKEMDTYKVGTTRNSCSTMHKIHSKEFAIDDFSHEHLIENVYNVEGFLDVKEPLGVLQQDIIPMLNFYRELYIKTKDKQYWWQLIQLLPSSYNQRFTWQANYQVLRNIYFARRNHKLDEWHDFCRVIETLPYTKELITLEV